ncbi:unnamed protein product [Parascedosporium putredinis]|uniref:PUM-HD domain-containing protein n=1 Tax=Parascedosporium putredinis TaxID=1442378 RepID=A0A9P1MFV6_9PEZI|nr:unnamed protein product [Parascedosporium putredinis]CAI8003179.1 unnamed protein product [Parascedosporium putredinis]
MLPFLPIPERIHLHLLSASRISSIHFRPRPSRLSNYTNPTSVRDDKTPQNVTPFGNGSIPNICSSPSRKRDSYFGSQDQTFGHTIRGSFSSRPKSFLDDEKDVRGFPSAINGFDMDVSRRQEARPSTSDYPRLRAVGDGPSRDPSMPPSRGTNESPGFQERFPFQGHTPSNSMSMGLSRASLAQPLPYTVGAPTHSLDAANAYDFNPRQQVDGSGLPSMKGLSLDERSSPSANGISSLPFVPGQHAFDPSLTSPPWPGESHGQRYMGAIATLDGSSNSSEAQYVPSKRGSIAEHVSPSFLEAPSSDRRSTPGATFVPQQNQAAAAAAAAAAAQPFYSSVSGLYFNPSFPASFHPNLYDPYAQANYRGAMVPNYPLAIHPYIAGGAGIALRGVRDQDPSKGMRSALLEDFRANSKSSKRYELKDIYGHIVEFSGDQYGSRFIQTKLETANSDEKDQVFREIEPNAIQLMKDVFGNYVIQKFFEHGNQVQKKVLAAQMKGKVVDLSVQMYACRVVQKALEHVLVEQQAELVNELEPEIIRVVRDQNGNHVVQKIIELVPKQYIGFIMEAFRNQCSLLGSHPYGCRVIQRMLEHGTEEEKRDIMAELHASAPVLIVDQYGNYVAQHVIEHGKAEDRSLMIGVVLDNLVALSKHKFASNVVEKCIEFGSIEELRLIRERLIAGATDGTSSLQFMMKDQYGNYVIRTCASHSSLFAEDKKTMGQETNNFGRKMLNKLKGADREMFVEEMRPHLLALKKGSSSRQLQALEKLMGPPPNDSNSKASSNSGSRPASAHLALPSALQVDSATPTPVLTMEPNSPQSSNPPSTNESAAGDGPEEPKKPSTAVEGEQTSGTVVVQDA